MQKRKLNYRIHNPNSPEKTADFLIRLFVEVNQPKVEEAIRRASAQAPDEARSRPGCT